MLVFSDGDDSGDGVVARVFVVDVESSLEVDSGCVIGSDDISLIKRELEVFSFELASDVSGGGVRSQFEVEAFLCLCELKLVGFRVIDGNDASSHCKHVCNAQADQVLISHEVVVVPALVAQSVHEFEQRREHIDVLVIEINALVAPQPPLQP